MNTNILVYGPGRGTGKTYALAQKARAILAENDWGLVFLCASSKASASILRTEIEADLSQVDVARLRGRIRLISPDDVNGESLRGLVGAAVLIDNGEDFLRALFGMEITAMSWDGPLETVPFRQDTP